MPGGPTPETVREHELKLRIADTFAVPDLAQAVPCVRGVRVQPLVRMTAEYYDTADLRLIRWGITLRRREGGADAGWHLKLPVGESVRDEVRLPLTAGASGDVPSTLSETVTAIKRRAPLQPVAILHTVRRPALLLGADGEPFAELVDDTVTIEGGATFRELEIEALQPDRAAQLHMVADHLVTCGATPGGSPKVTAALGARVSDPADVMPMPPPRPKDRAADAVRALLADLVHRFLQEDIRVRRDQPDAVHQLRVAARQLRSGLKVFAPLVDADWAQALRRELGWAADGLGGMRDAEVLRDRLSAHAEQLPEPFREMASRAVIEALEERMAQAHDQARTQLRSERYLDLLDALVTAATDPQLTDEAQRTCRKVLPPLVEHSWRRLAKDVKRLQPDSPATDWHRARIDAKKTRYSAELTAPILGRPTHVFAHRLGKLTDVLGDQHDADVAQDALSEMAAAPGIDGSTGYALGLLAAVEQGDERRLRGRLPDLWPKVERAHRDFDRST